ncbi:MAG: InlB B-repeat-containing protein, partial [Bifidobacteriales bacterium]|nr:InlB B-repeat-containing protein [Bifidobacteriales bacterium]
MPAQQSATDGNQASRPHPDPSRDGYLFDGWFLEDANGDSKVAYDFSQPVTGNITLVAHWSPADTGGWSISPSKGNAMGGQQATITPPKLSRGIRFSQISANHDETGFSIGVASDGNAYAWGDNEYGQLGKDPDKTPTQKTPVKVPLPDSVASGFTYTQVAAGGAHVVAIGSDQTVYAWGLNDHGQLGNGSKDANAHPSPMPVKGADGQPFKAVQISAGSSDSAAIDPQGRVYTWGSEHYAAYSCGTARPTPTLAKDPNGSGQGLHAVQVSANYSFIMALDADGNVYTWGYNNYGQLGNGTSTADKDPTYAADPARVPDPKDASKAFKAAQISAGGDHALTIGRDGTLWAWGWNGWGQLGDGTHEDRLTPMQVRNPKDSSRGFKVSWISPGLNETMVGDENGTAWAWGFNSWGQLGINSDDTQDTPVQMSPPAGQDNPARGFTPARASSGSLHGLAIGQDGNAYSWGCNWYGQLGNTSIPTGLYVDAAKSLVPIPVMLAQLQITGVKFDQAAVGSLQQNSDGSVSFATPAHNPGQADVIVDWTLGGVGQTQARLAYTYEGTLPLTGGNGSM